MSEKSMVMRAYKDGDRLVFVIENADKDMEDLVKSLLNAAVLPKTDMVEPAKSPTPKTPDVSKMDSLGEARITKEKKEKSVSAMNVPELREYLTENSDALSDKAFRLFGTDVDTVAATRPEKDLRRLAACL